MVTTQIHRQRLDLVMFQLFVLHDVLDVPCDRYPGSFTLFVLTRLIPGEIHNSPI